MDKCERLMNVLLSACAKELIVRSYHVIYAQEVVADLAAANARIATLEAQLAEKEAENERMTKERDNWERHATTGDQVLARTRDKLALAEAQRDEALKALEPFAREADSGWLKQAYDGDPLFSDSYRISGNTRLTVGHLRAARRALTGGQEDG